MKLRVFGRTISAHVLMATLAMLLIQQACWGQAPPQAAAVGYKVNTFSSTFSTRSVDVNDTFNPGFQWYPSRWYYNKPTDSASITLAAGDTIVLNSDGAPTGNDNGQISSFSVPNSLSESVSGIVGEAFGGGGYFEATLKFDPSDVFARKNAGWPSWWGMSVEHLESGSPANKSQYWYFYDATQKDHNYAHFAETDFFEYDVASPSRPLVWGGNMADWFGVWTQSTGFSSIQTPWPYKQMPVPPDTDFTQFHKYGYLWVPATTSTDGYAKYYFDDKLVGAKPVTWSQYQGQDPPATKTTPWAYGILDQQHIGLILGSGVKMPMTVKCVNVWQSSANQNIGYGTLYDTLYDLSRAFSCANMSVDTKLPPDFNGDAFRACRQSDAPGALVYSLPKIASFTARIFAAKGSANGVAFEISPDSKHWTTLKVYAPATVSTTDGWTYQDISNSRVLPRGMNYLRITLTGHAGDFRDHEIGQVRIN